MKAGDVIYEEGIYKVKFIEILPAPSIIFFAGQKQNASTNKGFKFHLFKNNEFYKSYSLASGYPYNYDLMKSTVINVLKPLMQ